jgi:hypothetical protein
MNGEVSVRRGDAEWVAGVLDAPLMTEDRIATAPNSRAEVQFDSSNLIRVGGNAEIRLAQIEYGRYQIEVAHGTVTYVVLKPSAAKVEVDTPNVSVRPDKSGAYRITVADSGETQVIARAGEVEVFTPRGSEWVNTGKMMLARGTASDPEFQIVNAPPLDEWDNWNQSRDRALMQVTSNQYVPEGVYGTDELDANGSWVNVAPYGNVWQPRVAVAGWAPYRHGRWVWVDWYGWTWVSYDPWGWAPYHYGRWFWDTGYGWCWYPGVVGRPHYWSPALVAWFGFGAGGVGFGFGNVGWVPLAPYETFHPWWGRGYYGTFNRNVNITNINVTNVYRNARLGNGVSGVRYEDFQNGRFNGISRFSGEQVRDAGLVRGQMPIAPSRSSLRFSDRAATVVPRDNRNMQFFSRQRPAAIQRIPFEQQRQAFSGGQPANVAPQNRGSFDNTRPPAAVGTQSRGGWQRFGEPSRPSSTAPNAAQPRSSFQNTRPAEAAPPQNRGSWQRFGEPGSNSRPAPPRNSFQGNGNSGNSGARMGGNIVRERAQPSAPSGGGRSYSPPPSQPSAPSRGGFGGGGSSAPRSSGGGGGGHSSGSGGGSRSSGGGGHSNNGRR